MKRAILLVVVLGGCGAADTSNPISFPPLPTGTAVYSGSLAQTLTTNARADGIAYTEVRTVSGTITLNANFNTRTLSASLSDPRSDFARSSTQSDADRFNFVEEATYSGTVSGTGTVSGSSFNSNLSGNLTQTSLDRSAVSGATPTVFTGTVAGRVSGTDYTTATGSVSLGSTVAGQTVPLFLDLGFNIPRN